MADTYEIPIKRRHYAGTTALEAGGLGLQHWAYDETNEQFGVRLADGTYRYHCRSKLYPPGAGTTAALNINSTSRVGVGTSTQLGLVDINIGSAGSVLPGLVIGADLVAGTTRTDSTAKGFCVAMPHYDNDSAPRSILNGVDSAGAANLYLGYGSGLPGFTEINIGVADSSTSTASHGCGKFTESEIAFNDGQIDMNLRWEADENANGLFCDAGARAGLGAVGIGCAPTTSDNVVLSIATPTKQADIFDFIPSASVGGGVGMVLVIYDGSTPYYFPGYNTYGT